MPTPPCLSCTYNLTAVSSLHLYSYCKPCLHLYIFKRSGLESAASCMVWIDATVAISLTYLCYTKHHICPFSLYISAAGMDSLISGLDPLQTDPGSAALPGQQFCKCDSILNHTAAHWSTESADIRLGKSARCSEWHNYCQLWTSVAAQ